MAIKLDVRFDGLEKALRDLDGYPEDVLQAVRGALYQQAEKIITDAKRIVPVDEGVLRASGHVQLPVLTPTSVSVTLGFGGPAGTGNVGGETNRPTARNPTGDVGYAVVQHEDLTLSHVKGAKGGGTVVIGQAKYLETPFNFYRRDFGRRLVREVRRRLKLTD